MGGAGVTVTLISLHVNVRNCLETVHVTEVYKYVGENSQTRATNTATTRLESLEYTRG